MGLTELCLMAVRGLTPFTPNTHTRRLHHILSDLPFCYILHVTYVADLHLLCLEYLPDHDHGFLCVFSLVTLSKSTLSSLLMLIRIFCVYMVDVGLKISIFLVLFSLLLPLLGENFQYELTNANSPTWLGEKSLTFKGFLCSSEKRLFRTLEPLAGEVNTVDYQITVAPVKWEDLLGGKWEVISLSWCAGRKKTECKKRECKNLSIWKLAGLLGCSSHAVVGTYQKGSKEEQEDYECDSHTDVWEGKGWPILSNSTEELLKYWSTNK